MGDPDFHHILQHPLQTRLQRQAIPTLTLEEVDLWYHFKTTSHPTLKNGRSFSSNHYNSYNSTSSSPESHEAPAINTIRVPQDQLNQPFQSSFSTNPPQPC
eukprot:GHVP01019756.1.p1 GENE.GHVP01019756.1~~GHVP01019756.1.p1  ORF type:complete len:101 (-),score=8.30 GHVP01019756.1:335-637(-)